MARSFLAVLFVANFFVAAAQSEYVQSAGVRLGGTSMLTYKRFIIPDEAIEVGVSGRKDGIQVTMTYQFYEPMEMAFNENFFFYYGIGGHIGYERYDRLGKTLTSIEPPTFEFDDRLYYVMGADAILGIEFRWLSVPMTIGFDVKPYINYIGLRYLRTNFWDASVSFKYVF
jgi:hypothetical protein